VNGYGIIPTPDWNKILEGNMSASEYPDECFWYIEARHEGGTVLLKRNNKELDVTDQQSSNSFIVSVLIHTTLKKYKLEGLPINHVHD